MKLKNVKSHRKPNVHTCNKLTNTNPIYIYIFWFNHSLCHINYQLHVPQYRNCVSSSRLVDQGVRLTGMVNN